MYVANVKIEMDENGQTGSAETLFWQSLLLLTLKHYR